MMTATRAGPDLTAQLAKLKAVAFLLDFDGDLASLQQMWRTEDGVRPEDIRAYVPDCPLVHGDVLALPALRDAIDVYAFDDLARDLATEIADEDRSEEHTSELQSLMRNSYAVFCLKKK